MAPVLSPLQALVAIALGSFLPPIAYVAWIRHTERYALEPLGALTKAFLWGATGGVALALVIESFLGVRPDALEHLGISALLLAAVIMAPVVEELTKAIGLRWIDDAHPEPEDGFIYGATVGFGFAATENLAYGVAAYLDGGLASAAFTTLGRAVSSTFLHGAATALVGFAIWRWRYHDRPFSGVGGAYLLAVALHAVYNLAASVQLWLAFVGALILAIGGFRWVRERVRRFDRRS